jgi:hypothetical protein
MPFLPYSIRDRHIHVIGKTGFGKSTLLASAACNDIRSNEGGVCVIDPKGDLVELILRFIPEERKKDCIWIDIDDPIPLDFMSCAPGKEQEVVNDLKFILTAGMLDTANAPTLSANIENLLYTLLNANRHPEMPKEQRCTFLDIADFLEDKTRQDFILAHITDQRLKRCWREELPKADKARILSRINPFIRSTTLSKVFGDPNPRLNMHDVINGNKILLVRVPVMNPSSATYGALLVSKLQQAAFTPSRLIDAKPFFLYIDEFQNFRATEAFEKVLEMARGYKLCLTLANLKLDDLDPRVVSALGIISSYVLFQISPQDASFYKPIIEVEDPGKTIRDLYEKQRIHQRLTLVDDNNWEREWYRTDQLHKMVKDLPDPPVTIQDAIHLERFKAIYKIDHEPAVIEDGPEPPEGKYPTPEQQRRMDEIKKASKESYGIQSPSAQNGQKRTEDNASCNPQQIRQDVRNEHRITSTEKPEVQPGSAPGNIPPHENKT